MTPDVPKKKISTSEVGHARNVAGLVTLHQRVSTFDAGKYKPVVARFEVASLAALIAQAQSAMAAVAATEATNGAAINDRKADYELLDDLLTRSIKDFEISGADAAAIADARSKYRKIKGQRVKTKPVDNPLTENVNEAADANSASQMSFDQRLASARAYVQVLVAHDGYKTNTQDLTIAALTAFLDGIEAKNLAVIATATAYKTAVAARNAILYDEIIGVVKTGNEVKKYVGSAFGLKSAEYAMVKDIKFRKVPD